MNSIQKQRAELRQKYLNLRQALPTQTWQRQSQEICNMLAQSELIKNAEVILGFMSFRQEPDLTVLYKQFSQKKWGFPRCQDQDLTWHCVNPLDFLNSTEIGKFGILEPISTLPKINLADVDVILVPAILSDQRGYRLGYGGGFYDRFLETQAGFTISIAFADFIVETFPNQTWDIPTKAICSENGIYVF